MFAAVSKIGTDLQSLNGRHIVFNYVAIPLIDRRIVPYPISKMPSILKEIPDVVLVLDKAAVSIRTDSLEPVPLGANCSSDAVIMTPNDQGK
jgi:hypothetical protein